MRQFLIAGAIVIFFQVWCILTQILISGVVHINTNSDFTILHIISLVNSVITFIDVEVHTHILRLSHHT